MLNRIKIRVQSVDYRRAAEFAIYYKNPDRSISVAEPLVFKNLGLDHITEPTFSISHSSRDETLQVLMDDLWNIGIRPTEGTGSAGSLKATQNHLEDMRKISFDLLEKKPND